MEYIQCGPCLSLGKEMRSSYCCVICEEALCLPCKTHHLAMKICKDHEVVEISKMHKPIRIDGQFCSKHASLPNEYFCIDHDILGCKECLAAMHRTCQNVMSVDIASKETKKSQSFIDSIELIKQILETIDEITQMGVRNIDDIEKKAEEIKKSVRTAKDKLVDYIISIENSLLQELDSRKKQVISSLMKSNNTAKSLKEQIREKGDIFGMVEKHGSEKQAFLLTQSIKQELVEAEKHVMSLAEHATLFTIDFNESILQDSIMSIGSINVMETNGNIKFVPIKKHQAQYPVAFSSIMPSLVFENALNMKKVKHNFNVRGMTVNEKNKLLLCNTIGSTLIVFDENNQYKYQITCNTNYKPWDIAVIPGTDIVVVTSFNSEYIQFIDIKRKKTVSQSTVEGSEMGGIAVSTKHVYVGAEGEIHVLDHHGRPVRTINTKQANRTPWFMTLGNNGNIYYTAGKDVTCIKSDGEVVFIYTSPDLDTPWDIKTDNHDNVYVIDYKNKVIHRLRSDGTFIDIVKDEGLSNPLTLCFDRNYTKLFVANGSLLNSHVCWFKLYSEH